MMHVDMWHFLQQTQKRISNQLVNYDCILIYKFDEHSFCVCWRKCNVCMHHSVLGLKAHTSFEDLCFQRG